MRVYEKHMKRRKGDNLAVHARTKFNGHAHAKCGQMWSCLLSEMLLAEGTRLQ